MLPLSGMFGFSKSLAREVGGHNITVNCVAPGLLILTWPHTGQ